MKNLLITVSLLFCSIFAVAQNNTYAIERDYADTTKFRFCTYTVDQNGSYNKSCTKPFSSDTIIQIAVNLADQKKAIMEAKPWESDFARLDTVLRRTTGKTYSDYVKDNVVRSLAGSWTLNYDGTDIVININQELKVSGGTIKGTCEINPDNSITLTGVLASPIRLTANKTYLSGMVNGKEVKMTNNKT